jgi:hypothetical protein
VSEFTGRCSTKTSVSLDCFDNYMRPTLTSDELERVNADVHRNLAALGYPGFSSSAAPLECNPTDVVLQAVLSPHLESRLVTALPWALVAYPNLEWDRLLEEVQRHKKQNRLGYLVHLARWLGQAQGQPSEDARLASGRSRSKECASRKRIPCVEI